MIRIQLLFAALLLFKWTIFSTVPPVRIHVPLSDLDVVQAKHPKAVLLGAEEYQRIKSAVKNSPNLASPHAAALQLANYTANFTENQLRLSGQLEFVSLSDEAIDLILPFQGIGFDRLHLDGNAAPLWLGDKGRLNIRLPGPGVHKIDVVGTVPLRDTPGGGTQFSLGLPGAVAGKLVLKLPGHQEIKTNAPVLRSEFDPTADSSTIELAIGGHENIQALLLGNGRREDQRAILIGNSAVTVSLDAAGQVLDAAYTLQVLRKGVRKFVFLLEADWTVTEVTSPDLVRWSTHQIADGVQEIEVELRNSATGTKSLRFKAHASPAELDWSGPRLLLKDADFQRGHLMVDPGLAQTFRAEKCRSVLRQDLSTAARIDGLTSSNGRLFFHWGNEWGVDLVFAPVVLERHSEEVQLLVVSPEGLSLEAKFDVTAVGHEMAHMIFNLPAKTEGWELSSVKLSGDSKGFEYRLRDVQNSQELRLDLEKPIPPEGLANLQLVLKKRPANWSQFLSTSSNLEVTNQSFPLLGLSAAKTKGLLAFTARGHLEVEADEVSDEWTPINVGQLGALGLGNEVRSAVRYSEMPTADVPVTITRSQPRLNVSSVGLYAIQAGSYRGSFRMNVEISRAPAQRFFILADKSLGQELSFAVQSLRLSSSRIVSPGSKTLELNDSKAERFNLWQLELDEETLGTVVINARFHKELDGSVWELPLIRPVGVDQVVEFAAIEAGEEFKVDIEARGTREVDTIDLPTLPVKARRILAAHRFLSGGSEESGVDLKLTSSSLDNYAIPSILAVETQLRTQVGADGSQQTEARWRIANVSRQFLEVNLPPGARLWSAQVGGQPVKPKSGPNSTIQLPLPLTREPVEVQIVYFLSSSSDLGGLKLYPPKLPGVSLNQTNWSVIPPSGYRLSDYNSNLVAPVHHFKQEDPILFDLFKLSSSFGLLAEREMDSAIQNSFGGEIEDFELSVDEQVMFERAEPVPVSAIVPPKEAPEEAKISQTSSPVKVKAAKPPPPPISKQSETKSLEPESFYQVASGRQSSARGRFTMPISLVVCDGSSTTFNGLGEPQLAITLARAKNENGVRLAGYLLGLLFAVLVWYRANLLQKLAYLVGVFIGATLIALWIPSLANVANAYFSCTFVWLLLWPFWSLGWKLLNWFWRWFSSTSAYRFLSRHFFHVAWGCIAIGIFTLNWEVSAAPKVFIPYGKDGPARDGTVRRVLLPYEDYVRLWNNAYPDQPLAVRKHPSRIFLREPVIDAKLLDEENFELQLRVSLEVASPTAMDLPLPFGNVAIQEVLFDGKPASVAARKQGGLVLHLSPGDKGVLSIRAVARPEVKGRAGSVNLRLPPMPAVVFNVSLGDDELELEAPGLPTRPLRNADSWQLATGQMSEVNLRWRPELGVGSEDRTLVADASHQVHAFHWGILGITELDYKFSGGERDFFRALLPLGARVSKLSTANLRDHRIGKEVQLEGHPFQSLEVRLHRSVKKQNRVSLHWIAPFPKEAVPSRLWLPRAGDVGRETGRVELHAAMGVNLKVDTVKGGRRINRTASRTVFNSSADASRFQGSYEWPFRPFSLHWEVQRVVGRHQTNLNQLVRISSEDVQLLSNVSVEAEDGLLFGSSFLLPVGYDVLNVVGPDIERWHIQEEGMGNLLHVDYRVARLKTSIAIVLVNEAPELEDFDVPLIRATTADGQLLESQGGQLAVQVAPALEARTLETRNLRPRPRKSVTHWLDGGQVNAVQFAYESEGIDAALKLGIQKRPSKVGLEMLVGVLVEETQVSYTYRLRYQVEGSPLDRILLTLPEAMAEDVSVTSPALRGIQHGSGEEGMHWWEVSLVNEVTGLVDVGVNFSRQITPNSQVLDIPELKTSASAGYRAVVAVQNFSRHQLEFQGPKYMRPATIEEQKELLDEQIRQSLQFVHQSFQPGWKAGLTITHAQESKRLEAIIDLLSMRTFVGKSGRCVYEVTLSLQNRAEQFIELAVPENLRLWSAEVDGVPVKPVFPEGGGKGSVAVPLVKTTIAGLPFDARLFFAGRLDKELKSGSRLKPPSIKPINIPVKRTNWSLFLPEVFDYHDLKGNMNPLTGTTELVALGIEAKLEQLKRVSMASTKKIRYGRGGKKEYWLKESLGKEIAQLEEQISYNYASLDSNLELREVDRGRLGEQLEQQKAQLESLNQTLAYEADEYDTGQTVVNGYINGSLVNPGLSEWDRNGALNIMPSFVSSAQDVQIANLNLDLSNNSVLLNNPVQALNTPALPPQQQRELLRTQTVAQPQLFNQQSAQQLLNDNPVLGQQLDFSGFSADSLLNTRLEASEQQQLTVSGGVIMSNEVRVQQLAKRQEFISSQLGNLADNRLNRYFQSKGRNSANARGQIESSKVQAEVAGVALSGPSPNDQKPTSWSGNRNTDNNTDKGLQVQNYGGFGGGGGRAYYGSALGLPVEDFQDAGTYSLQIDFPEVGRQLDFSYPGDDPSISLSIRDSEARSRNVATLSLIGLLALIFGAYRFALSKRG
ncbi:MAG: hypothetical protein CMO33_04005 [Verrucomicrobia bacterium]|nr:hypothetical protein [Verrucomicrobiota bacterium]